MTRTAIVLALSLSISCAASPSRTRPTDVAKRTALALFEAYNANEVQADTIYKGLWLEVDGTIDDIGKDILDTPYVTFDVGSNAAWGVQAMFERGRGERTVAGLHKGQYLTVVCQVDGKLLNVILQQCETSR